MLGVTSKGDGESTFSPRKLMTGLVSLVVTIIVLVWYLNPLVVTVTGTGEVTVKPEKATVSFIVSTTAADANDVIGAVKAKVTQITEAIALYGIGEENITQSQVSVIPPALLGTGATNYSATVTMSVDITDYSNVNSLVAFLYSNGVSYVSQPVLSVADSSGLEQEAYNLAVKDAAKKASKIALKNLKFFKKKVLLSETTSVPSSSNISKVSEMDQTDTEGITSDTYKATSEVSLTYKMW